MFSVDHCTNFQSGLTAFTKPLENKHHTSGFSFCHQASMRHNNVHGDCKDNFHLSNMVRNGAFYMHTSVKHNHLFILEKNKV